MNCYEAVDLMGDALEGTLAAALRDGFDGHLAECRPCRVYMEQLVLTRGALGRAGDPPRTSPHRDDLIAEFRRRFGPRR